jgi:hypothetical protein
MELTAESREAISREPPYALTNVATAISDAGIALQKAV